MRFGHSEFDLKGTFTSFEIAEDDQHWEQISQLLKRYKVFDTVKAEYSDREMAAAEVLGLQATSQWGYPEPSGDFGYLSKTFDLAEYCNKCGIGGRQRAPFRLNTIPKLRGSLLQLIWVLDEFFVDKAGWRSVFEPFGVGYRPVVLHGRSGVG